MARFRGCRVAAAMKLRGKGNQSSSDLTHNYMYSIFILFYRLVVVYRYLHDTMPKSTAAEDKMAKDWTEYVSKNNSSKENKRTKYRGER